MAVNWKDFTPVDDKKAVDWSQFEVVPEPVKAEPAPTENETSDGLGGLLSDVSKLGLGGAAEGAGTALQGFERAYDSTIGSMVDMATGLVRGKQEAEAQGLTEEQAQQLAMQRAKEGIEKPFEASGASTNLRETGKFIQEDISPAAKLAVSESQIKGDVTKPGTWSFGDDPSVLGFLLQGTQVAGQMAPIVAASRVPGAASGIAAAQAGEGAYQEQSQRIREMPQEELAQIPAYRELIAAGADEAKAREVLADQVGLATFGPAAMIGSASGPLASGTLTKPAVTAAARSGMGKVAEVITRRGTPLLDAVGEGGQEVAEAAGTINAANELTGETRDVTEGSLQNAVMGTMAMAPTATVHSILASPDLSPAEKGVAAADKILADAGVATGTAPEAPPAPVPMAERTKRAPEAPAQPEGGLDSRLDAALAEFDGGQDGNAPGVDEGTANQRASVGMPPVQETAPGVPEPQAANADGVRLVPERPMDTGAVETGRVGQPAAEPLAQPTVSPQGVTPESAGIRSIAERLAAARNPESVARPVDAGEGEVQAPVLRGEGAERVAPRAVRQQVENEPPQGASLRQRALTDFDTVEREYAALTGDFDTDGGRILNTDNVRELSPEYRNDRSLAADVHEASSDITKEMYARRLAKSTPEGKEPVVVISAGGAGAGKSTGLDQIEEAKSAEMIYDTTVDSFKSGDEKIQQALAAGRDVVVVYTYRDPVEAFSGALGRASRIEQKYGTGRTVPVEAIAKTHAGSAKAIRELQKKYEGNDRVHIMVVDNSRGAGNATVAEIALLPEVSENGLKEKMHEELERAHQERRISDKVRAGFAAGKVTESPARGTDRRGDREEPARANEKVSLRDRIAKGKSDATSAKASPAASEKPAGESVSRDSGEQDQSEVGDDRRSRASNAVSGASRASDKRADGGSDRQARSGDDTTDSSVDASAGNAKKGGSDVPKAAHKTRVQSQAARVNSRLGNYAGAVVADNKADTDRPRSLAERLAKGKEKPESPPTSTKNEVMRREREESGRPDVVAEATKSNPDTLKKAIDAVKTKPEAGREIVERLLNGSSDGISLEDEAILLVEKREIQNRRNAAADRASDPDASEEQKAVAKREWEEAEEALNAIDQATYQSGKEWGRFGQFRQRMLKEDFTFEALERKERVREGRPLTPEEVALIRDQAKKIADLQAEVEKTQKALDDASVNSASQITYTNLVQEMATALGGRKRRPGRDALHKKATESKAELRKIFGLGRTNAGVDPRAFFHLSVIGADVIVRGYDKLVDWMGQMKVELGDRLFNATRPALAEVYKAAKLQADPAALEAEAKAIPKPADIVANISPDNLTHGDVYELARAHVRDGVHGEKAVMEAVHKSLKGKIEGITEREVRRLFSDYGKAKFPSKEADKIELRELRALVQMQESIDRLTEGLDALKSGVQRDKATQEIRERRSQLNDLLKVRERAAGSSSEKLATYQEMRANNLRNQIEDLEHQIASGERPERVKAPEPSPEVKSLMQRRDGLRDELRKIDGKPPLTPEERANRTRVAGLKKQLEALENQLLTGLKPEKGKPPLPSDEVKKLREKRDELKAKVKEAAGDAPYQEARAKSIAKQIAEVERRISTNDYTRRTRPDPPELNKANKEARFKLDQAKTEFARRAFESEMAKRPRWRKFLGGVADTLNLARAAMTSLDLSAVFRQGGFIALGHPDRAIKGMIPMLRAMVSEEKAFEIEDEINSRPNASLYKKAGLDITERNTFKQSKIEEAFQSRWAEKLPKYLGGSIIRGSQRAFTTFLNKLRADTFDSMLQSLALREKPTLEEAKAIANYINIATGRGKIGSTNSGATGLNTVFFAPRLVASRFNLLAGQPLYAGSARTRVQIAKEYARFLTGVAAVYSLAALANAFGSDDDDELMWPDFDPRSFTFGKIRIRGDDGSITYLDPLAGLAQVTVFLGKELSGEKVTMAGKLSPIRKDYRFSTLTGENDGSEKIGFGEEDAFDVAARFARTKLAPVPGAVVNLFTGENMIGEEVTPTDAAVQLVTPMSLGNVADVMEDHGVPKGTAITMLELLGFGVTHIDQATYHEKKSRIEQKLDQLRVTAREEGESAARELIDATPELSGVRLHRFATTGKVTNKAGGIEIEAKPGSTFAKYKAAEKAVKSIDQEIEAARSGGLSFTDRLKKLKELQKKREAVQRDFTAATKEWKSAGA